MPNKKEALMVQAVFALAKGCGTAEIADDAADWFYGEYFPWIDKVKQNGKTPHDVWDQHGKEFLEKFREIGHRAAQGGTVQKEALTRAARAVETESECPFCPIKP
ncbi:MAG TPA: hypothetical protein VGS07_16270 [Thermoanaerobaculia bacterium]|jgi:hypothetical protein|nr:hypothetical protein [Thermoanaerobaculia bacterium]